MSGPSVEAAWHSVDKQIDNTINSNESVPAISDFDKPD